MADKKYRIKIVNTGDRKVLAVFMAVLGMFMWANAVVDAERLTEKEAQLNLYREMYRKDTEGFSDVLVTEAAEKEEGDKE